MASRRLVLLLGLLVGLPAPGRGVSISSAAAATPTSSDPSCVTIEVDAASTAKSFPDCPAVLLAVSLTASTENCASDISMLLVMEDYPRDVNTYGGESSAALQDKTIAWTVLALTEGSAMSLEFRLDLCGYCDTYSNGSFNPIDTFQYEDAEGNEPNDRKSGYQLKLDCAGIEGDPVESINATPAPFRPPTPSPTAAATPETSEVTMAPSLEAATTAAPTGMPALSSTVSATRGPFKVTMAPSLEATTAAPTGMATDPWLEAATSAPSTVATASPTQMATDPLFEAATPAPTMRTTAAPTQMATDPSLEAVTPAPTTGTTAAPTQMATDPLLRAATPTPTMRTTAAPTQMATDLLLEAATSAPTTRTTAAPTQMATDPLLQAATPAPSTQTTAGPTELVTDPLLEADAPAPTTGTTAAPTEMAMDPLLEVATPTPSTVASSAPTELVMDPLLEADAPAPTTATMAPSLEATTASPTEMAMDKSLGSVTPAPSTQTTAGPTELVTDPLLEADAPAPTTGTTAAPTEMAMDPLLQAATPTPSTVASSAPTELVMDPLLEAVTPAPAMVTTAAPTQMATDPLLQAATPTPTMRTTAAPTQMATDLLLEAATSAPTTGTTAAPTQMATDPLLQAATPTPTMRTTAAPTQMATDLLLEAATSAPTTGTTAAPTQMATDPLLQAATSAPTMRTTAAPTDSATASPTITTSSLGMTQAPVPGTQAPTPGTQAPSEASEEEASPPPVLEGEGSGSNDDDGGSDGSGYDSTGAPTPVGEDGSRGMIFTASPTAAPSSAPTSGGNESSRGITLEIQSIFEARRRRRALSSEVSHDGSSEGRALSVVYEEDAEAYDEAMVDVCASMVGVDRESVISVWTSFGPDGAAEDAARRGLMTSSSSSDEAIMATQLTPVTTCEVDLSGEGDTRSMAAATMVDRLMQPENFVLAMDENQFGPVNVVVTSISFWQNECRDQTCPAGDGSYASVYPIAETSSSQSSVVGEDTTRDNELKLLWFAVIAGALFLLAVLSWCIFCLCCGGPTKWRKPKPAESERYSVKSPPNTKDGGGAGLAVLSPQRYERSATATSPIPDGSSPSCLSPGRSPVPPQAGPRPKHSGRKRTPPPRLSTSPGRGRDVPVEPPSPGEADWRHKFGLGPLRDYTYRSAPISPRRSPLSVGSASRSAGEPFYTSYQDHVVAAADGNMDGKVALTPLADDASAAMESQVHWHVSDEVNASVQHNNDPVVRSSLAKAGTVIANAITSPRKELNRLKEALNRPSGLQACHSTSPTVTASSADPSSMPGFFGSEGGFSPGGNNNAFGGSSSGNLNARASSPIYEIDLEADENGGAAASAAAAAAASAAGRGLADGGASEGGDAADGSTTPRRGRAGSASFGTTGEDPDVSTPLRTHKAGRNMFAKAPGSSSRSRGGRGGGGSSHGATTPTSPSNRSTCTDRSGGGGGDGGEGLEGGFSVLATAAAFAEVKVGVESPTGRAVRALAAAGGGGSDKSVVADKSGDSVVSDEGPPGMPSLPAANHGETSGRPYDVSRTAAAAAVAAGAVAATKAYGFREKPDGEEDTGGGADPALSPRGAPPPAPFGGMLSGFGCMAPQLSPGKGAARLSPRAGSRLPEIDDDDSSLAEEELEENEEVAGRRAPGSCSPLSRPQLNSGPDDGRGERVGQGEGSASAVSLEKALALSRSRTMTPELKPIAEMADSGSFTDSEAGSEVSSCLSSMSGRSGYRVPRDPAALLAAAMEKAGQVAAIPPPSSGSHGRSLSSVQEVPMEGVPLPGLATPEFDDECGLKVHCSTWDSGSTTASTVSPLRAAASTVEVDTTVVPIPSPAQRPESSDESGEATEEEEEEGLEAEQAVPRAAGHARGFPSPARSRQEEEDEVEEHRAWEEAMQQGEKTAAAMPGTAVCDDDGIPALASPSPAAAPAGAAGQASAASASGAAGSSQDESSVGEDADKPPAFSLKSALSAFLGRKDNGGIVAPAHSVDQEEEEEGDEEQEEVEEEEEEGEEEEAEEEEAIGTVTIDAADDSAPPDFARSPESHTLDMWPEAIGETQSKSSLDEGFVDVKISHVAMEEEDDDDDTDDEAMLLQEPAQGPAADTPTLVIQTEEADASFKPGQTPFSRAAMNLQSPGPDSPKALREVPMPALPMPPSPSMPKASMTLQTPKTVVNPRRISDASPMYDREAIATAMARADQEQDGDSDIVVSRVEWPSERRINSYTDSSVSGMSEMTSSSCSGGDGGDSNGKKAGHGL